MTTATVDTTFVDTRVGRVQVRKAGSGRPLVYLHSAAGEGEGLPLLPELARHFSVIAPMFPGFGESEGIEHRARGGVLGGFLGHLQDELREAGGELGVDLLGHRGLLGDVLDEEGRGLALEGQLAADPLEEGDAERVDVVRESSSRSPWACSGDA